MPLVYAIYVPIGHAFTLYKSSMRMQGLNSQIRFRKTSCQGWVNDGEARVPAMLVSSKLACAARSPAWRS